MTIPFPEHQANNDNKINDQELVIADLIIDCFLETKKIGKKPIQFEQKNKGCYDKDALNT